MIPVTESLVTNRVPHEFVLVFDVKGGKKWRGRVSTEPRRVNEGYSPPLPRSQSLALSLAILALKYPR
jgi:hypothetical protein